MDNSVYTHQRNLYQPISYHCIYPLETLKISALNSQKLSGGIERDQW